MTDTVEVLRQEHRNIESLLRVLARLGPFLAHLLGECNVRAHGETAERAVEHAVSMKIHLMTIGGFQESELAGRVDARDGRDRLIFVLFHLPLQAADMILQPPTSGTTTLFSRLRTFTTARNRRENSLPSSSRARLQARS